MVTETAKARGKPALGAADHDMQPLARLVPVGILEVDSSRLFLELVYFPPYHSKYNPIERCWSALERADSSPAATRRPARSVSRRETRVSSHRRENNAGAARVGLAWSHAPREMG